MQLGIDFGTTRTIVAYADRGNYPVVNFPDQNGDFHDYFPSVAAFRDGELVFGFEAEAVEAAGGVVLRSFKRVLAGSEVNETTEVTIGENRLSVKELLLGFTTYLHHQLANFSSIADTYANEANQVTIAVPAHAHSAQRFLTLDAFRQADFSVAAMLNEPSAAGFEYTHRKGYTLNSKRTRVIIYDLGGGTFDASLISVEDHAHDIINSLGINHLGGDDFDIVLAKCAVKEAGIVLEELSFLELAQLLNSARLAKEYLSPQTRRIPLTVAGQEVDVMVDDFYQEATGLVLDTMDAMEPLVDGLEGADADVAGIYLVGGAAGLPLVPRVLRERFGRRVHRSPYPSASTAIGLAIASDPATDYSLNDRLSRGFGVFRESSAGRTLSFDPIFGRDWQINQSDNLTVTRKYQAAHNVGWFRFVEYSHLSSSHEPVGDLMPFARVIFPFTDELQVREDLSNVPVERTSPGHWIEEVYQIDPHGIVELTIRDLETGFEVTESWGQAGLRGKSESAGQKESKTQGTTKKKNKKQKSKNK